MRYKKKSFLTPGFFVITGWVKKDGQLFGVKIFINTRLVLGQRKPAVFIVFLLCNGCFTDSRLDGKTIAVTTN